jgi:hypothetical protein
VPHVGQSFTELRENDDVWNFIKEAKKKKKQKERKEQKETCFLKLLEPNP